MTRKEEIFKASADAFNEYGYELTKTIKMFWLSAFIDGAKWADNNPSEGIVNLNDVWHDAGEEPSGEYEIICQDEFGHVWLTDYQEDTSHYQNGWKECTECECIIRWAHISDMLQKGGEK